MPGRTRIVHGRLRARVIIALSVIGSSFALAQDNGELQPLDDPISESIETGQATIRLEVVAKNLTAPNWGTTAPRRKETLFVTDQDGIIWSIDLNNGQKAKFLDISERLVDLNQFYDERGLLGLAFHPKFQSNGLFYTYTSQPIEKPADFSTVPKGTKPNHQSVLTQWRVTEPANPESMPDPNSAREVLRIDQPQANHNGTTLVFGPDGYLFISLGDGGAADDQGTGHVDGGNGQEPGNILGTIIRIDPTGSNSKNGRYGIPSDNPFVDDPRILDEIYAYGLRNPFRFSFDRKTGDLYAGDVGQTDIEEVDIITAGDNFGWRRREGTFDFHANGDDPGFVTKSKQKAPELVAPIAQYDHDEGNSVIGGFVYRGQAHPDLAGYYIFGDYSGRLLYLKPPIHTDQLNTIYEFPFAGDGLGELMVLGFGEDADGELYVLANESGSPSGKTGVVLRIGVP